MNVLVDSDVFCKLGAANLLEPALLALRCQLKDGRRLPSLPYMLRRGRLPDSYGVEACTRLAAVASTIPVVGEPGNRWLDSLASVTDIDPGEAQLFAKAAEDGMIVMTGDKKALSALSTIPGLSVALCGRIVVLEAILMSLCAAFGVDIISQSIRPIRHLDTTLRVCFSDTHSTPVDALSSYYEDLVERVHPLVLWHHKRGDVV